MKKKCLVLSALLLSSLVACDGFMNSSSSSASVDSSVTSTVSSENSVESVSSDETSSSTESVSSVESSSEVSSESSSISVAQLFKVSVDPSEHATVVASCLEAEAGTIVTLSVSVDEDYAITFIKMNDTELTPVDGVYSFTMPEADVTITYAAHQYRYAVTVVSADHATVTASATKAEPGETVTLSTSCDDGFRFTYIKLNGEDLTPVDGVYSFTMPEGNAEITYAAEEYLFAIALPSDLPEGITMEVSRDGLVEAGSTISLYVRNTVRSSKRVKSVSVGDEVLTGSRTNDKDCTLYSFVMPDHAVSISAVIADVYAVSAASDVAHAFGLSTVSSYEAGEVVEFSPVLFAGYWARNYRAVEEGVVVSPVEDKPGFYSFTMPAHPVTITADVGQVGYKVSFENRSYCSISYHDDFKKEAYKPGDTVKFALNMSGTDASLVSVSVDGSVLTADGEGYYSFAMPAYPVAIEPEFSYNYKTFEAVASEYYDVALTTMVDGVEVPVENAVLSNQEVFVTVTEKEGVPENNIIVSSIALEVGENAESAASDTTYNITKVENNRFKFETRGGINNFYRISLVETASLFKNAPIVGEYNSGYKPYYSGNYKARVTDLGVFEYSTGSSNTTFNKFNSGNPMVAIEGMENAYTNADESQKVYFDEVSGAILLVTGTPTTRGSVYLYVKNSSGNAVTSNDDIANITYSYRFINGADSQRFLHLTTADGSVYTVFYDHATGVATFGATVQRLSGSESGTEKGDKVAIYSREGELLNRFEITTKSKYGDGYEHTVKEAVLDGYEGTYASSVEGSSELVLDGFGTATYADASYAYSYDETSSMLTLTGADATLYFVLDVEAKTYVVSRGPTDGFEGTYTYGELTAVVDGYGVMTIGETEYSYTIVSNRIVAVSGDTTLTLVVDKAAMTLTDYVAPANEYINKTYYTYWYEEDEWDYSADPFEYEVEISFTTETEAVVKYREKGYGIGDFECQGTYEVTAEGVTITFVNHQNTNKILALTKIDESTLKAQYGFTFANGYEMPAANILVVR